MKYDRVVVVAGGEVATERPGNAPRAVVPVGRVPPTSVPPRPLGKVGPRPRLAFPARETVLVAALDRAGRFSGRGVLRVATRPVAVAQVVGPVVVAAVRPRR